MNFLRKITSLLMILVIFACVLVSCVTPATKQKDLYRADVRIVFATNDESMKAAVEAMNSSAVILVSGEDMQVETTASINNIMLTDKYVIFLGTLYHEENLTVNGSSAVIMEKAEITSENRNSLISDLGAGATVEVEDFGIQNRVDSDGNVTYSCAGVLGDTKDSLEAIFASKFQGTDATVELEDAEYVLETEDDFVTKSVLSCNFLITMGGKTYEITMHVSTTYDYTARFGIAFPINADEYTDVSYEDIIG